MPRAFDLVDHSILFHKLLEPGLPLLVVCFLLSWYGSQQSCMWEFLSLLFIMGFPMVFVGVVFSLHFFLLCICIVYYLSWLSVVLVVIEKYAGCVCYADDNYYGFTCALFICSKNNVQHLL